MYAIITLKNLIGPKELNLLSYHTLSPLSVHLSLPPFPSLSPSLFLYFLPPVPPLSFSLTLPPSPPSLSPSLSVCVGVCLADSGGWVWGPQQCSEYQQPAASLE